MCLCVQRTWERCNKDRPAWGQVQFDGWDFQLPPDISRPSSLRLQMFLLVFFEELLAPQNMVGE